MRSPVFDTHFHIIDPRFPATATNEQNLNLNAAAFYRPARLPT